MVATDKPVVGPKLLLDAAVMGDSESNGSLPNPTSTNESDSHQVLSLAIISWISLLHLREIFSAGRGDSLGIVDVCMGLIPTVTRPLAKFDLATHLVINNSGLNLIHKFRYISKFGKKFPVIVVPTTHCCNFRTIVLGFW